MNLIDSNMNMIKKNNIHPSFSQVIKQMYLNNVKISEKIMNLLKSNNIKL